MINIRVAEKPANSLNQRCQMFQEQIISFPETDNEQESVPVGCVPHACQPRVLVASTRCQYRWWFGGTPSPMSRMGGDGYTMGPGIPPYGHTLPVSDTWWSSLDL